MLISVLLIICARRSGHIDSAIVVCVRGTEFDSGQRPESMLAICGEHLQCGGAQRIYSEKIGEQRQNIMDLPSLTSLSAADWARLQWGDANRAISVAFLQEVDNWAHNCSGSRVSSEEHLAIEDFTFPFTLVIWKKNFG